MRVIYISIIVVIFDQITKLMVKGFSIPFLGISHEGMMHGQRIPVIDDFFRLTFIENFGMAFGYDPGLDFKIYVSVFSLIASIGLAYYLYHVRDQKLSLRISLAFILGGAVGNLIDRMFYGIAYDYAPLFYGKVVDFLDFDFFDINIFGRSYDRFPIFNIADMSVTIGVFILLIFYKHHQKVEDTPPVDTNEPKPLTEEDLSIENTAVSTSPDTEVMEEKITDNNSVQEEREEIKIDKNDLEDDGTNKGKELPL